MRQGSPPIFSCDAVPGGVTILGMAPTQRPLTVQLPGELAAALRNYALVTRR